MRNLLTFVALALVTALTVALLAPPLIDWSARPEMVARAIALRIGAPVRISGPISLRLLPTPYLEIADVAIGPRAAPWLTGRSMRFEFGLSSLFGGKIALDDISFDRPSLTLGPAFAAPADGRLAFGHIRATHAEIRVERAGASPIVLHDVRFSGAAASSRGPWRGDGDFAVDAHTRAHYQFASEAFADDALPIRGEVDSGANRADFDGRLVLANAPAFAGTASFAGDAPAPDGGVWPVRVAGPLEVSGDVAAIADAEVRLGDEARALAARGRVALNFGAQPTLDADLKGKTFDFDALLRRNKETSVTPERAGEVLAGLARRALGRDAPGAFSLKLQSRAAYLGARTLVAPEIALVGAPAAPLQLKFASGLPGRGQVALDGALELGAAPILRGHGRGEVGDFAALASWVAEGEPDFAARLRALGAALPQGAISAAGDLELSPEGYSVRGLKLGVAESKFDGSLVFQARAPQARARLYLDLATPALDIEAAPNVEAGFGWLGAADLDFRLQADALRVARAGLAPMSGGSLAVRVVKDDTALTLKQLSLADLGGASIEGEGERSPSRQWLRVKLDAARLTDFADLAARAAPGVLTRWLAQHAEALGAAKATFEARREGPPPPTPFGFDFLKSEGTVAGARFALTLSQAPAPVDALSAQASVDSPDAVGLLRKLGFYAPAGAAVHGELAVGGNGQWDRGFDGKARLALAGAEATWSGGFRAAAADAQLTGPLTLKSVDLLPALVALGVASPGPAVPANLAADLEADAHGAKTGALSGSLAGIRVSGDLAYAWDRPPGAVSTPALTGRIGLDRAALGALLSLALGRPTPPRPGEVWSDGKFGPALLTPPSLDVALEVAALDLGFGPGREATARLQMDRDRLALVDASTPWSGGKLSGRLDLRRSEAQTTAAGALTLEGVAIAHAGASARLDANLDFVGAGETPATLIGGLAGAGRIEIGEAKAPRLDPQALARVYARLEQAQGPPPDPKSLETQIGAELDKAPMTLDGGRSALALTQGDLRFGPFEPAAEGSARLSGAFDLTHLSLALDAVETYAKVGRFWSGGLPQVEITETGVLETPTREVDAEFLAAGLAAQSIARETDRIANFEADVRERAMFNRKRKAQLFLDRRAAEIASFFDDQERQRLMDNYLGPYSAWAATRGQSAPAPSEARAPKDAARL